MTVENSMKTSEDETPLFTESQMQQAVAEATSELSARLDKELRFGLHAAAQLAATDAGIAELRKDAERGKWLIENLWCEDGCLEVDINIYCHGDPNTQDKIIAIDKARSGE